MVMGFPNKKNPANSVFNLRYAEELQKNNNKVSVIYLKSIRPFQPLFKKYFVNDISIIEICTITPGKNILKKSIPLYEIFKLVISKNEVKTMLQNIDVIHAIHRASVDFSYIISEKFNKPMISQFIGGGLKKDLPSLIKRKYFVKGLKKSKYLCYNSKRLNEDFLSIVNMKFNNKVIYRGVKLIDFPYNFLKSAVINILFLGGFPGNGNGKGGITLLKAIKLLDSSNLLNPIKFIIGGPCAFNFQNYLKGIRNPNISIEFIGAVAKEVAREKLKESHIVIIPSLVEGLPNVLFESMASGNMLICTTVGGIPEFIDDGVNGILISPNNPKALMNELIKATVSFDSIEEYAKNNRKKIENYNYDLFVDEYMNIYNSMVSKDI